MFRGVGRVHQMILMLPSLSLFPLARAYSRDLTADFHGRRHMAASRTCSGEVEAFVVTALTAEAMSSCGGPTLSSMLSGRWSSRQSETCQSGNVTLARQSFSKLQRTWS